MRTAIIWLGMLTCLNGVYWIYGPEGMIEILHRPQSSLANPTHHRPLLLGITPQKKGHQTTLTDDLSSLCIYSVTNSIDTPDTIDSTQTMIINDQPQERLVLIHDAR